MGDARHRSAGKGKGGLSAGGAVKGTKNMQGWLERNTFHHSRFSNISELVKEKERQGLKISLCLPSLNEEKTIAKEVVVFKSELMSRYPLLDELAVIDSGSTDATCEIAASFGADVYPASEILPECGEKKGKGENLWKAIYQLKGDIIVYVDADIKNIHPRFAYGLIAPLILRPDIKYVKAFYDRPLTLSKGVRTTGGGRVTELLVRPLFALFFPELTALIQPLSGEYAVRREVLESIPFPIGYGVETAHIIDVYHRFGLDVLAQVDLDQRVHRNQSTQALGRMSFGILQTFLSRIEALGYVKSLPDRSSVMRQFQVTDQMIYEQTAYEIPIEERPPMAGIEAYRRKFHGGSKAS